MILQPAAVLIVSVLFITSARAHHTALPEGMSEPEAAWLWGYHTIPSSITRDNSPYWYGYTHDDVNRINNPAWTTVAAEQIRPGANAPAVLVMHGCAGIVRSPTRYRLFFMKLDYAVFQPDSFARPGREPCVNDALGDRREELEYAFEQIRELPWVDPDRIVLMGISEGGAAVAHWDEPGFQAHIILAYNCGSEQPAAPDGTPVLAVVGGKDELFIYGSSCNVTRMTRGSRSIVIQDAPHDVTGLIEVQEAIGKFLDECCQ